MGSIFASHASPKASSSAGPPTRGKRSTISDTSSHVQPKRGRHSLVQSLPNGAASRMHKRKASSEDTVTYLTDGLDPLNRTPRIRLKYRPPQPLITHPLHIPLQKNFSSLSEYLDSFILLEDHEDITLEKAETKAQQEAAIRDRITHARARGWLDDDSLHPSAPRKQPEPQYPQTRHDILLKHVLNFASLMAQERRSNISRAKKIAQMITQHFKKLEGTDEKELKAEEKRIRRLAKQTAQEVRKKWRLAEKVNIL